MKDNDKLYKVYHRNYSSIEELYDDLNAAAMDITLHNKQIVMLYGPDTLMIEQAEGGYITCLNGKIIPE